MHEVLRQRLLRKIETLPEERIYQVLDYIEFLSSRYGDAADAGVEDEVTGLQRFAERLEDGLRRRTVRPGNLREAFQLIAAADRVLSGVASAGREFLDELDSGRGADEDRGGSPEGRSRTGGEGLPRDGSRTGEGSPENRSRTGGVGSPQGGSGTRGEGSPEGERGGADPS